MTEGASMQQLILDSLDAVLQEYRPDLNLKVYTGARLLRFADDADWLWFLIELNFPRGVHTPALREKCLEVWRGYSDYHQGLYAKLPTDYSLAWETSSGESCQ